MPSVFNTGSGVASTILQSKEEEEDGSEGGENEIDPMPDFKPIVQLDEVEVKTGTPFWIFHDGITLERIKLEVWNLLQSTSYLKLL